MVKTTLRDECKMICWLCLSSLSCSAFFRMLGVRRPQAARTDGRTEGAKFKSLAEFSCDWTKGGYVEWTA